MARRWTSAEEDKYRNELIQLYVTENKTIGQISEILGIKESTVFDRIKRLQIPSTRDLKPGYNNSRHDITIPTERSEMLAEFFGIMLGDGHVAHFQTFVTLGTKEIPYVEHVAAVMSTLFGATATIFIRKSGYRDVYLGSVQLTTWLKSEGLVQDKVKAQVGVPDWIFQKKEYMEAFLRGFFDTDGSVYKLKFGIQLSFTNCSAPILIALQSMLRTLGYKVSNVSCYRIYVTKQADVLRFFTEIAPKNSKHTTRFETLTRRYPSG